ncbi:MAG: 2-(5''-triphosphoribosyl)-3'-dephosphocoenzyme-A synthase [Firmicutes bacterium ADurb.Bin182]|nr:MAG: 2-(5''-triphosphoribosyl)-3'-dephosphocoenzyme-A synthase [Firmicutes bacterium ADurb.Bin182]
MKEIDLSKMLRAREERKETQERYLSRCSLPLICFTLNIPGPVKTFPLAKMTFETGVERILRAIDSSSIKAFETAEKDTGYEAYFAVGSDAEKLKARMAEIEDADALGRLFDIDVLEKTGRKLSRPAPRKCLLCENSAAACSRSRAHGEEAVKAEVLRIMRSHFKHAFMKKAADSAYRALLYEADATPKPGLVDRRNRGAHSDMDICLFRKSAEALRPYFYGFAGIGAEHPFASPQELADLLRPAGLAAEAGMLNATGGVNTHKGLIFSMGLLLCSLGALFMSELDFEGVFEHCAKTAAVFFKDLQCITAENAATHGEKLYAAYGVTGIRGEAAAGFPNVRETGLPVYGRFLKNGFCRNDAAVLTLLELMASVQDTNVLSRGGEEALEFVMSNAKRLLGFPERMRLAMIEEFDDELIQKNISPGGCADLLAVTLFAHDILSF